MSERTPAAPTAPVNNPSDASCVSPGGAASSGGAGAVGPYSASAPLSAAEARSLVHPLSPLLPVGAMPRFYVHWFPRLSMAEHLPSPWGIRNRAGWAVRWVVDEVTRVCGFVLLPPPSQGSPVFIETTGPAAKPAHPLPDPFRDAVYVSAAFGRLVRRTGRLPATQRLTPTRRGGTPVRLQGWYAVKRLHEVLTALDPLTADATAVTAMAWAEFDPPVAGAWQAAGCTKPWRALRLAQVGVHPVAGTPWTHTAIPPEEVALMIAAGGWSVRLGDRLRQFAPFHTYDARTRPLRKAWLTSGLPPRTILACLAAGVLIKEHRARPMPASALRALAALRQDAQP